MRTNITTIYATIGILAAITLTIAVMVAYNGVSDTGHVNNIFTYCGHHLCR